MTMLVQFSCDAQAGPKDLCNRKSVPIRTEDGARETARLDGWVLRPFALGGDLCSEHSGRR